MSDTMNLQDRRERAMAFLRGKVLRRTESDVSGGVSGVISTKQVKHALFLYEDNTFQYDITEFRSVSSGGYSFPSEETQRATGDWEIRIIDGTPYLVLLQDGSPVQSWRNSIISQEGLHGLDGEEWNRYLIRH